LPEFFTSNESNLALLSQWFPVLLLFIVPAITMSAWADERKLGTDELLFTLPASDLEIVLAKYLSVVAVYSIVLAFSAPVVFVLEWVGDPDWGLVVTNYLGYWLAGTALLAAGMFASSLTSSVTVAFVLGVVICAVPVLFGYIVPLVAGFFFRDTYLLARIAESLSVPDHLRDFGLGMVPLAGLLYFASLAAAMLYLNVVVVTERHWSRSKQAGMGAQYAIRAVALAVALVSLNAIAAVVPARADLTAENLYTLSSTTREVLRKVPGERPVTIQAFMSTETPQDFVTAKRRLIGLLRQYDGLGGGRVEVRYVDVPPSSEQAAEAEHYGILPTRLVDVREGRRQDMDVYLGAVITSTYDEVVLPFIGLGTPIEYELTRSIRTVTNQDRLKVGILETDADVQSGTQGFGRIVDELKKQYTVEQVSADAPIEKGRFNVLIAVMPSSLTQPQMDNFVACVRDGNPVLIFDDPWPYVYDSGMGMGITQAPRLPKPSPGGGMMMGMSQPPSQPKADGGHATSLVRELGIEWDSGEVVWDTFNPHKEFFEVVPREFVFISPESGNRKAISPTSPITGSGDGSPGLQEVLVVFAGTIRPRDRSGLSVEPLLVTSDDSGLFQWDEFSDDGFDFFRRQPTRRLKPDSQRVGFKDEYAHIVAAHITSGRNSDRKINAVFVADVDMISDWFFHLRERAEIDLRLDNVEFVLNAVDVLAGDEQYLPLRKRRAAARTLDWIEARTRKSTENLTASLAEADQRAKHDLERIEESFKKQRDQVSANEELDPRARDQRLANIEESERRQMVVARAKVERQKSRETKLAQARADRERTILQNWVRLSAAVLAGLPPILFGGIVLSLRLSRERREIPSGRLA
ncbi:MAG TPA: Gldg family protein, partial [Planctomycetaceae bacterium]|nr:Gldg family protein [Planctomycetaceae bacterium]